MTALQHGSGPFKPSAMRGDGRDSAGRFADYAGPGRPPRTREVAYQQVTIANCTREDWAEITQRAVADAKDGDAKAREWLGAYLLGKPGDGLALRFVQDFAQAVGSAFRAANRYTDPAQRAVVFNARLVAIGAATGADDDNAPK